MFYARVRRTTGELCSASTIEGPKLLGRARKVEFGSNHGAFKQFSSQHVNIVGLSLSTWRCVGIPTLAQKSNTRESLI